MAVRKKDITIKGLNSRLRRVRNKFGKNSAVEEEIMSNLRSIEGLKLTQSGYLSETNTDKLSIGAAEANIFTISTILKDAYEREYAGSEYEYEDITEDELIALAEKYAIEDSNYDALIRDVYNAKPADITSAASADFRDLLRELRHPGRKLTADEINANIDKIKQFLGGIK